MQYKFGLVRQGFSTAVFSFYLFLGYTFKNLFCFVNKPLELRLKQPVNLMMRWCCSLQWSLIVILALELSLVTLFSPRYICYQLSCFTNVLISQSYQSSVRFFLWHSDERIEKRLRSRKSLPPPPQKKIEHKSHFYNGPTIVGENGRRNRWSNFGNCFFTSK